MSLKPWRQVITPHEDVSAGRYHQSEFAADLAQVLKGDASAEYQDSVEFYSRTYLTDGMRKLLKATLERISGKGGEPVVKLKTSFGGGKTHTMLAIFHLIGGTDASRMKGIPEILTDMGIKKVPKCRVAVLVGSALDPTKPRKHPELGDMKIRTLWGEMAVQLGGREGYSLVQNADEKGVAPGSDTLVELFDTHGPCIILIDELVTYARNIFHVNDLPGGSFDSNMSFIHNLTEAAKRSKNSILVASIPESNIEIGGEGGQSALERLEHTFGRLEAVWQPVGPLESFEIVRRRIFSPVINEKARDDACSAFYEMYREQSGDFPSETKDRPYLERLKKAYPIHPELFDRLYNDWATLEKFQRTRGVLRLMAAVVHELWVSNDQSPMIMPGSLPLYATKVKDELTRYLGDQWGIIVDKDVDGKQSEPHRIDIDNKRFGSFHAATRVSRTIFLGSAPSVRQQNVRGIEDVRIKLGVVLPEENLAIFSDATTRLMDRLTYLYHDNRRYWFDTRPNLRRTVNDRAIQWDSHEVEQELKVRLQNMREKHPFAGVHVTSDPADIPDEDSVRLVVLDPEFVHRKDLDHPAEIKGQEILDKKGTGPRIHKNMLIFLAPDASSINGCLNEIRQYLAWESVLKDEEQLGLDAAQRRQAKEQIDKTNNTVNTKITETYSWIVLPNQEIGDDGPKEICWNSIRVSGSQENPIARAGAKLVKDGQLITQFSPMNLKLELDRLLWKDKDCVNIKQLWDYFTTYLYLPRLKDENVFIAAIREGLKSEDFFAFSNGQDSKGKYLGLSWKSESIHILLDGTSLLIHPEIARKQFEIPVKPSETGVSGSGDKGTGGTEITPVPGKIPDIKKPVMRRFHGSISLEPTRVARDASRIAEEVLAHLNSIPEATMEVHLEIEVKIPNGAPENVVRTVSENTKTLKFRDAGFEEK